MQIIWNVNIWKDYQRQCVFKTLMGFIQAFVVFCGTQMMVFCAPLILIQFELQKWQLIYFSHTLSRDNDRFRKYSFKVISPSKYSRNTDGLFLKCLLKLVASILKQKIGKYVLTISIYKQKELLLENRMLPISTCVSLFKNWNIRNLNFRTQNHQNWNVLPIYN